MNKGRDIESQGELRMKKSMKALIFLFFILTITATGLSEENGLNQTNNETEIDQDLDIVTGPALVFDYESALVIGELKGLEEGEVNVSFKYREMGEEWIETGSQVLNESMDFIEDLEELRPETDYEYKAVLEWNDEELVGEVDSFTTPRGPGFQTSSPSDVISDFAVLRVNLGDWGDVDLYFRYRELEDQKWINTSAKEVSGSGVFEKEIRNLEPGTTYEFKPVLVLNGREVTGTVLNFTTLDPLVNTLSANAVLSDFAILQGNPGRWDEAEMFFRYREVNDDEWMNTELWEVNDTRVFEQNISDLEPSTTYEFKAVVDWGEGEAAGEVLEFTTLETVGEVFPDDLELIIIIVIISVGSVFIYLGR